MIALKGREGAGAYSSPCYVAEFFFSKEYLSFMDEFFEKSENFKSSGTVQNADNAKIHDPNVRRTDVAWLLDHHVVDHIERQVRYANDNKYHYNLTFIEPIQCSLYRVGGFYDKHSDVLNNSYDNMNRKLSFIVCLSDEDEYEGGDLFLYHTSHCDDKEFKPIKLKRNEAIFFPSYITHEVKPVTKGIRKTLVGWALGPNFY